MNLTCIRSIGYPSDDAVENMRRANAKDNWASALRTLDAMAVQT